MAFGEQKFPRQKKIKQKFGLFRSLYDFRQSHCNKMSLARLLTLSTTQKLQQTIIFFIHLHTT